MLTHTIEVNHIDTIAKHLIEINQQLTTIKKAESFNENLKTYALMVSPILSLFAVWLLFVLTRKKEHHSKRSELSGEIYSCVFELNRLYSVNTSATISALGYNKIFELKQDPEYSENNPHPDDQGIYSEEQYLGLIKTNLKDITENNNKILELSKDLRKYVGQYRQHLSSTKRKKFIALMIPIYRMSVINYDLDGIKNIRVVEEKIKYYKDVCLDDFKNKYNKCVEDILDFLGGYK